MRVRFKVVITLAGGLASAAAACSSTQAASRSPDASVMDAGSTNAAEAGSDDASDDADVAAPPPPSYLRLAQVSAGLPAVDFCVAVHGTGAFEGPLLGQLASSLAEAAGVSPEAGDDAGPTGVAYLQVSAYVSLAAGAYDVRLVPAGAAGCAPSLSLGPASGGDDGGQADGGGGSADEGGPSDADAPDSSPGDGAPDATPAADATAAATPAPVPLADWTALPALAVDGYATLLVAGDASAAAGAAPLTAAVLPDDAVIAGGAAVLRAINAAPGSPALDFGLASAADWLPLLTDVRFGAASAQAASGIGAIDANGYLPISPLSGQTVSARPSSADVATDIAVADGVEIDPGSIATVIAAGGAPGDAEHPAVLLFCTDNQPSGGILSDCSVGQR